MKYIILGIVILFAVIYLTTSEEKESYSFQSEEEGTIKVDHDTMEQLVLTTNKYLNTRVGCGYIVETQSVKKIKNKIYECKFMAVSLKGFPYGYSVISTVSLENKPVVIRCVFQQVNMPRYMTSQDMVNYDDYITVNKSEIEYIKNKFRK